MKMKENISRVGLYLFPLTGKLHVRMLVIAPRNNF